MFSLELHVTFFIKNTHTHKQRVAGVVGATAAIRIWFVLLMHIQNLDIAVNSDDSSLNAYRSLIPWHCLCSVIKYIYYCFCFYAWHIQPHRYSSLRFAFHHSVRRPTLALPPSLYGAASAAAAAISIQRMLFSILIWYFIHFILFGYHTRILLLLLRPLIDLTLRHSHKLCKIKFSQR